MFKIPVIDIFLKLFQQWQVWYPSLTNFLQNEKKIVSGTFATIHVHLWVSLDKFKPREITVVKIDPSNISYMYTLQDRDSALLLHYEKQVRGKGFSVSQGTYTQTDRQTDKKYMTLAMTC